MLRIWSSVFVVFILSCSGLCLAQSAPSQGSAGSPSQAASSSAQSSSPSAPGTAAEEDDDDSPDIPRIARAHQRRRIPASTRSASGEAARCGRPGAQSPSAVAGYPQDGGPGKEPTAAACCYGEGCR